MFCSNKQKQNFNLFLVCSIANVCWLINVELISTAYFLC